MSSEKSATTAAVSCSSSSNQQQQQKHQQYQHGKPPDGWECLVTMEDINENNYVEYYCCSPNGGGGKWKPAKMEQTVIQQLLQTQFHNFVDRVHKTDCQAELKRLLKHGPPIYISDPHGLPMDDDDDEKSDEHTHTHYYISKLWYCSTNTEISAKLDGAVEGEERQKLWNELKEFIVVEGKEEGDDDDDNDNQKKQEQQKTLASTV